MKRLTQSMRDELSAYLDGEASNPSRVEGWIRDSAEARAYLDGLRQTSDWLRTAPQIIPSHGFADKATRALSARTRPSRIGRWVWIPASVAMAAIVLLMVSPLFDTEPTYQAQNQSQYRSPEALEATLVARIEQGEPLEPLEGHLIETAWTVPNEPEPWAEAALTGSSSWVPTTYITDTSVYAAIESDLETKTDLHTILTAMDQQEADLFRQLLADYMTEG